MRSLDQLPCVLACGLLLACGSSEKRAAAPAAAPATPATPAAKAPAPAGIFRLPGDVRPTRQRVELEVAPDRETFSGKVEIFLELDAARDDLWVSARGLNIESGSFTSGGGTMTPTFEPDDARGATRIVLPRKAAAGPASITLGFRAPFNPRLVGLYRVQTRDRWYAYTQFEAVDARRAFPCFDEPSFKIPWDLVLTVPATLTAVANTNVKEEVPVGANKRLTFDTTRPLPSYLVALAVGEFDVVTPPPLPPNEVRKRPLQVRGIAPKGRGPELAYALQAGADLTVMLERWFGTEFPYDKLDHIAVPDFEYGAMENAGLITYREQSLLIDSRRAPEDQKLRVIVLLAHEIAHQWYGDLVTMAWWDDLWLNESFASVMETKMTHEWAKGSRYDLKQLREVHNAMYVDELSTVNAIRPTLHTESDIFGFDYAIAYPKGAWVINMFEQYLGPEAFRAGVMRYLAKHADGNATMDDLLASLSGPGEDLAPAMRSFVVQPGIPLVQASLRCDGGPPRVTLSQSRNLPLGSTADKEVTWQVPVCVRAEGAAKPACMLLAAHDGELPLATKRCPSWIAPNPGAQGYYRWALPPEQLRALLARGYGKLSAPERLSLGNNLAAGVRSGAITAADAIAAMAPLARDPEPAVAEEPADLLERVHDDIVDPAERPAVAAHLRTLYRPALARLGWKARPGESTRVQSFRAWVVARLALHGGDREVLARAAALGRAYLGSDGKLHPEAVDRNLADVAVQAAARLGDAQLFDTVLERLFREQDSDVRERLLKALGHFTDPALADKARALTFDDRLRVNERGLVIQQQGLYFELRGGAWAWIKDNFDRYAQRLPPSYVQFVAYLQNGCSEADAAELEAFLGPRAPAYLGAEYTLGKAVEVTKICAAQAAAQRESASRFFARH